MIRGFYSAASSLISQQANLDAISNNIANVNTIAFKAQQVGFSSLLYENLNGGAANNISVGHGVRVAKTGIDFKQGDLNQTNMPMDCAIVGPGFFAIEDDVTGGIAFTRDGSFQKKMDQNRIYLINSTGGYVLDTDRRRVEIQEGFDHEQIGVFDFDNPYGLQPIGGNAFISTGVSGNAQGVDNPNIKAGCLERSSVELSKEMVKMIEASKAFSLGARMIQTSDEMEKMINQLR